MNNKFIFLLVVTIIIFTNCCKKKNIYLAKNYYEQSLIEAEDKNYKKALQLLDQSIALYSIPQAFALKATLFYQIKEFSESLKLLKKIIDDKNTLPSLKCDVMNNYACTLLALKQHAQAEEIWKQLSIDKNYLSPEVAFFNLGLLSLNNTDNKQLHTSYYYFNKAIESAPGYIDAYFYLAKTLIYLQEYDKCKKILIFLLKLQPEHEQARVILRELKNQKTTEPSDDLIKLFNY